MGEDLPDSMDEQADLGLCCSSGMKLAQKNKETSRLPHGKLGRSVPRSGRRDNPSLVTNLVYLTCTCRESRQTLNLLKDFGIVFVLFCFIFIIIINIIISMVTILEAFHYFLHVEQVFIFCSFFGKRFEGHFSRNT